MAQRGFFWPEGGDFLRPVFDPGFASNDCFAAGAAPRRLPAQLVAGLED